MSSLLWEIRLIELMCESSVLGMRQSDSKQLALGLLEEKNSTQAQGCQLPAVLVRIRRSEKQMSNRGIQHLTRWMSLLVISWQAPLPLLTSVWEGTHPVEPLTCKVHALALGANSCHHHPFSSFLELIKLILAFRALWMPSNPWRAFFPKDWLWFSGLFVYLGTLPGQVLA